MRYENKETQRSRYRQMVNIHCSTGPHHYTLLASCFEFATYATFLVIFYCLKFDQN